ncbi:collagen-like triple helix repeat-containing protein, partial [Burkholderia cenocepacia]
MAAGATISEANPPGVGNGVTTGLGNTVTGVGTIIRDTSNAVSNGIGQTGFTANPVGTTVAGLGSIVGSVGNPVAGLGDTVKALG